MVNKGKNMFLWCFCVTDTIVLKHDQDSKISKLAKSYNLAILSANPASYSQEQY